MKMAAMKAGLTTDKHWDGCLGEARAANEMPDF